MLQGLVDIDLDIERMCESDETLLEVRRDQAAFGIPQVQTQ